jgi:hypothetical protein
MIKKSKIEAQFKSINLFLFIVILIPEGAGTRFDSEVTGICRMAENEFKKASPGANN